MAESELKALRRLLDAGVKCKSFVGFSRHEADVFNVTLPHHHNNTRLIHARDLDVEETRVTAQ